jgi:hypothetical protein
LRSLNRAAVVCSLSFSLLACDRLGDVKRCRELAGKVNASLDEVEAEASRGSDVHYKLIAKKYDKLASSLDGFDGGTPELGKAVAEYASLARSSARQVTVLEYAGEANNPATRNLALRELDRLAKRQKTIVTRIDDECRTK